MNAVKIIGNILLYFNQFFKNRLVFNFLLITGVVIFSFQILVVPKIEPIWEVFGDPLDYLNQSKKDLFSLEFLSPTSKKWFSARPFTTSLFYKLADSDPYKMVMLQKFLHCICSVAFALIFIVFINTFIFKIITFYLFLFLFSWLNIVGWTNNILSESISNSLLFLWLGFLMLFILKPNWLVTFAFFITTILFSFTRDSWPYIILITVCIVTLFIFFKNKKHFNKSMVVLLFSIILFYVQGKTSEIGQRHKLPVFNSIVGRISKSDNFLQWFEEKGMPMKNQIKQDFKYKNVDTNLDRGFIYEKYTDSTYLPLMNWAATKGKTTYQLFLVTHPSYFFLFDQNAKQVNRIFCHDCYGYFKNDTKKTDYTQTTFPLWNFATTICLIFILLIFSVCLKNILYAIPTFIGVLFFINALLLYNADAMEVERHLYNTQIIIQLINIMSFSLLINIFINLLKKKKHGI